MSKRRSDASGAVQASMFVFRVDEVGQALGLGDQPRWQYPCGLCNGRLVTEPGSLCSVCAPVAPRSRRKTAKPRKTAAKKATARKSSARGSA
jgi:hypothetical protein